MSDDAPPACVHYPPDPLRAAEAYATHLAAARQALVRLTESLARALAAARECIDVLEQARNEAGGLLRDSGATNSEVAQAMRLTDSAASKAVRSTGRPPLLQRGSGNPDADS